MHFNQTGYKLSAPIDALPGTKLGTAWISIPLSFVSLKDGTFASFQLSYIHTYFRGLLVNSDGTRRTIYPEYFDIDVYFAGKQHYTVEGSGDDNLLNLTIDDVKSCGDEHILVPVDIYTVSEFYGIGTYLFEVDVSFYIDGTYFYVYAYLAVDVNSGKYL